MKKLIVLIGVCISLGLKAQFPQNSQQCNLQWSDEFNFNLAGGATKAAQINYLNTNWRTTIADGIGEHMVVTTGPNIEVSNGTLKLITTKRTTPATITINGNPKQVWYDSDWLITRDHIRNNNQIYYGYYEMRVKLPDRGSSSQSQTHGIQYAWWTHSGAAGVSIHPPNKPNIDVRWAELDFIEHSGIQDRYTHNYLFAYTGEITGAQYPWRYQNQINFNVINGTDPMHIPGKPSGEEYADFRTQADPLTPADVEGFHTMSCEVTPQKITWYMDGVYLQSTAGETDVEETLADIPLWNMEIFNQAIEGFEADYMLSVPDVPNSTTLFPYVSEMDFVRYYKFNCNDAVDRDELLNGGPFINANISDNVYGTIKLGLGTGGARRIQNGDDVTVRAVESVELLPGFEVEIGGEFYADVHECGI
jgi:beta-glucanase (GH16 family)